MNFLLSGIVNFFKPFLIALFGSLGKKLLAGFLFIAEPIFRTVKDWFTKLPLYLAWSAMAYIILAGFMLLFTSLIENFAPPITPSIELAAGWFLPSNAFECVTLVLTAKVYRFAYDHKTAANKNKLVTGL